MRIATRILLLIPFAAVTAAIAEECETVLALSKTSATTISDRHSLEQHASNFCREYAKGNINTNGTSFGASFKFLSASLESSSTSIETIASKYCSASNNSVASSDAYRHYIDTIDPRAYDAYQQCLQYSKSDVRFNVNPVLVLPHQFSMSVSYKNKDSATMALSTSRGITCKWQAGEGTTRSIRTGTTEILECSREDQSERGFVTIVRSDDGSASPVAIPWAAYDKAGNKIDALADLQARLRVVESRLADIGDLPAARYSVRSGVVVASSTMNKVPFAIRSYDTRSLVDSKVGWPFKAPRDGVYSVSLGLNVNSRGFAAGRGSTAYLLKNDEPAFVVVTGITSLFGTADIALLKGDVLDIGLWHNSTDETKLLDDEENHRSYNWVSVHYVRPKP